MDFIEELQFRELLYQSTDIGELRQRLNSSPITLYIGFDPTADSLHVGHLLPIIGLMRFQRAGHFPIALVGGGTGLIGDPSGKTTERVLNPEKLIEEWTSKIREQLEKFLDFDTRINPARMVNNYEWLGNLDIIPFLRDVGKHFPISYMLSKESVKARLEGGITYTEFSYMILQSYDFYRLFQDYNCEMQAGGSDQWGNITAGIDLIRRVLNKKAYGMTYPLVVKAEGTKFGKTESGTIWLDENKTTPYQFYQFWINTDDRDVIKFLKYFTFLTPEEINDLEQELNETPEKRSAQRTLAREVTELVHGKEALLQAEKISQAFFYGSLRELSEKEMEQAFEDIPSTEVTKGSDLGIIELLQRTGACSSKRQAREYINNGAVYINDECIRDIDRTISTEDRLFGKYTIVRRGKKNYFLVKWV